MKIIYIKSTAPFDTNGKYQTLFILIEDYTYFLLTIRWDAFDFLMFWYHRTLQLRLANACVGTRSSSVAHSVSFHFFFFFFLSLIKWSAFKCWPWTCAMNLDDKKWRSLATFEFANWKFGNSKWNWLGVGVYKNYYSR